MHDFLWKLVFLDITLEQAINLRIFL